MQKRILAIHDISCFGRCSLTVALPIISASGAECTVMPTAVLSTHTGGFKGFTFADLTEELPKIAAHWKTENLTFDGIYTGYLGSFEQLDIVKNIIAMYKTDKTFVTVDPVMGDGGALYPAFNQQFAFGMAKLCGQADVIIPNMTEAAFMLGIEYKPLPYTEEYVKEVLERLLSLGCGAAILTGIAYDEQTLGAAIYDGKNYSFSYTEKVNGMYHGTGDVFGSAFVGAVAAGKTLARANEIAVDFTAETIRRKYAEQTDMRFGVPFEECLGCYMELLK